MISARLSLRRRDLLRPVLAAAGALLLSAPALAAQVGPTLTLTGRVVDSGSGKPLAGAMVEVERAGRKVRTDSEGLFRLTGLEPGLYAVTAKQLGYAEAREDVVVGGGADSVRFALAPDPFVLEGLTVEVDRFKRRRNALPFRVNMLDREALSGSAARDARQLLKDRAGIEPCGNSDPNCARVRGQPMRVRLFIDERPSTAGMVELESFEPEDIFMVEIYRGGQMVRVYTHEYMERAAKSRILPEPIQI